MAETQQPGGDVAAQIADTLASGVTRTNGWLIVVLLIFVTQQVANHFIHERVVTYVSALEETRQAEITAYMQTCADQVRRSQEQATSLATTIMQVASQRGLADSGLVK